LDRGVAHTLVTGYQHRSYADSLKEFGTLRELPFCGGWILERSIPGTSHTDAMGCYPIFCCRDWSKLGQDLDQIGDELVSVTMVADPFGEYDPSFLKECFRDHVVPFKQHFVVDLKIPFETHVSAHHRRNAKKALQELEVEICQKPSDLLDDWRNLYGVLKERHHIKGIAAFSDSCFKKQLAVPGIVAIRAKHEDATVGIVLWYVDGERAYYHLGAYSLRGYELKASFALFHSSIHHFGTLGLRWLSLGAGAGVDSDGGAGLNRFKEGWSNSSRSTYLCGRILDREKYDELVSSRMIAQTGYFPGYRLGEFQ
jgi:hypothetical protein